MNVFDPGRSDSRDWHAAAVAAITLIATVFFIVWAWWMLAWGIQRPQVTPVLGLPLWLPQASILV